MDRSVLKERGKSLFKKSYWYSVVVTFLMTLADYGSSKINFDFDSGVNVSTDFAFDSFNLTDILESGIGEAITVFALVAVVASLILKIFVFSSLKCGGIRFFMRKRKDQNTGIGETIENFRDKTFLNIAKVSFFKGIYIFLWSLLFIIPGIVKSYEFWAADYILAVRPNADKDEALQLSKTVMQGNKWNLFVLQLSFIGWEILSSLTLNLVGVFYAYPYMQATFVEFFSEIRAKAIISGKITAADIPDYSQVTPPISPYTDYQYNGAGEITLDESQITSDFPVTDSTDNIPTEDGFTQFDGTHQPYENEPPVTPSDNNGFDTNPFNE